MQSPSRPGIDPAVFWIAAAVTALFVAWGVFFTENLNAVANLVLYEFLIPNFGWAFVLLSFGFVAFSVYLAFSRFGKIRLGADGELPEFRTVSWIAMMFSAGMGIGLMFYGAYEPLYHFANPPFGLAEAGTREAGQTAMEYSFFHWALHPWAIYAIMGLSLAYFCFRRGMPNLISTAFYPLLGERVRGPLGKTIDILAIFATLFGSATSLGLGALQVNGGLHYLVDSIPNSTAWAVGIIAALTAAFIVSAISGVHRGIQWLSNTNMVLAVLLLFFLFVAGPTVFILNAFTESVGGYASQFFPMSFRTAVSGDSAFLSGWTIYYWAWWISWSPFVGTFIARISRGRTIREFVFGVLLVPSVVSFVWFSILGGGAINLGLTGAIDAAAITGQAPEIALFNILGEFPLVVLTSIIAITLIALFFVSGADAASVVMGMLSSGGHLHPRTWTIVVWGVLTGGVAAVGLIAGGQDAIQGLQYVAIASGAPFAVILVGLCFSLHKALREDMGPADTPEAPEPGQAMSRPREVVSSPQQMAAEEEREPYRSN